MNPVFVLLVITGVALLYLLLAFAYKPIGALFRKLFDDAKNAISENKNINNKGEDLNDKR